MISPSAELKPKKKIKTNKAWAATGILKAAQVTLNLQLSIWHKPIIAI